MEKLSIPSGLVRLMDRLLSEAGSSPFASLRRTGSARAADPLRQVEVSVDREAVPDYRIVPQKSLPRPTIYRQKFASPGGRPGGSNFYR